MHRAHLNRRLRSLGFIVAMICVASAVAAVVVWVKTRDAGTPAQRANRLSEQGDFAGAEQRYLEILQSGPVEVETLLGFIDNHAVFVNTIESSEDVTAHSFDRPVDESVVIGMIERHGLPADLRAFGRYWYRVRMSDEKPDAREVAALADRTPPARWANHMLGRGELIHGTHEAAAKRFEREGLAFPGKADGDLERALRIWSSLDEWDEVRARVADPRYAAVVGPSVRIALAEHDRDWPRILRWLWPATYEGIQPWPVALALLAGVLWFSIGARMGRIGEPAPGRKALYVTAFILGVLSVYPTLVIIAVEDVLLGLQEVGNPVADAIFYVFGVGLREELCKLLLFLPLLPLLARRGSRIEAMTCGAFVGLGFAAEENVGYFRQPDVAVALGRFLTANFLHMALTSIAAVAAYDGMRSRRGSWDDFKNLFPLVVLLHGAYDFFLSSSGFSSIPFIAMGVLFIISRIFLREMMSSRASENEGVLRLFVISLAILSGVSYVYATTLVGPLAGLRLVAGGLLGVAILVVMFVRELSAA